jgi:tetratricopeptide (TPR) repeat protein
MKRAEKAKPVRSTSAADCPARSSRQDQSTVAQATTESATAMVSTRTSTWPTVPAAGLIVLSALAAYYNSFVGTFVLDDIDAIVGNQSIRRLWPVGPVLSPPHGGETVSGRPVLNLSLAINYALGGLKVGGYHAANLAIHVAAALLFFGILRRTFLSPALRDRFGRTATPLALAAALLWMLHPLQTESVTYIVQRAESLAGLFYLLTLYCVIRGAAPVGQAFQPDAESAKVRLESLTYFWYTAAVLACLLGMACKEVMVTAPLMVLLYDRTFLTGSFGEAWRRRWGLYLGLAATWGLLAYLVFSTGLIARQGEMGAPDAWSYARTQPGVILHYLWLSVWPRPLCLIEDWSVAHGLGEILPGMIVVGLLLAVTVWGLLGGRASGFLGAWFFLILAPTSSILPLGQLAYEHRMYLPLAAVAVLAVAGGYAAWDRLLPRPAGQRGQPLFSPGTAPGRAGLCAAEKGTVPDLATIARWAAPVVVLAAVLTALGYATALRNADYRSAVAIWQDVVDKRPRSPAAQNNLGTALDALGRTNEAIEHYQQALQLYPDFAEAHNNLGLALAIVGKTAEAIEHYQQALRLKPDFAGAEANLGLALAAVGKTSEASEHYQRASRLKPDDANAQYTLGNGLAGLGRTSEAIEHYHEALRLRPDYPDAHNALGAVLAALGRTDEAIEHYQQALQASPGFVEAHNNLANVLTAVGRHSEAIEHCRQALRLKPDFAEAYNNLARVLTGLGRSGEAIECLQQALRLKPEVAIARYNLARLLASVGRTSESVEQYRRLLQQMPDSVDVLSGLAWLLATSEPAEGGDAVRAVELAERARALGGQENARCLDILAAAYAAAGRFGDAVTTAQRALQLAESAGQAPLARLIQGRLELYRAGRPYREVPRAPAEPKP